jgi:uncharacterized protein GlcG (DUF336 family)
MNKEVTFEAAQLVIEAARKKAEDLEVPMNIAVVDAGGNLKSFVRMDKAWLGSIQIAQDKAFTARAFDMSTKELAKISQPDDPAFGIHSTNGGRVVIFPGGIPLKADDEVVGGIGVSGGLPDQDHEVALAGVKAFEAGS